MRGVFYSNIALALSPDTGVILKKKDSRLVSRVMYATTPKRHGVSAIYLLRVSRHG